MAQAKHSFPVRLIDLLLFAAMICTVMFSAGCVISPRRTVGGGGGGSGATPTPTPAGGTAGKLYVSNLTTNSILRYDNASSASGNTAPAATISGSQTLLSSPQHIFVAPTGDKLFVANQGTAGVLVFDAVSTKTGNVAPARSISGPSTGLASPVDVALDEPRDLLYVADTRDVLVFSSGATANGNILFLHDIQAGFIISALFLDSVNDRLFLADSAANAIHVYDNASTLNLKVAPTRTLGGAATQLDQPSGVAVDAVGKLIVGNAGGSSITVYVNAAAISGNIAPAVVISGASTTLNTPAQIAVSRSTTLVELFVANFNGGNVPIFSDLGSKSGNISPSRNISGGATGLTSPGVRGITLDTTR
jgi:sugar lactone lactonase YvrE